MTRVRFAPFSGGALFVSGARVALANYLFCKNNKGTLLLRLDDLEPDRGDQTAQIEQDLRWLGVGWDQSLRQSERMALYQAAIERLRRDGFLYPCFESEDELKAKAEFRRKRGQPAIYDRAMLKLTDKQRGDAEAGGKRPHWRFKLSGRTLEWRDMIQGNRRATLSAVSDPVLVLADGRPTNLLASVIDDLDARITHIIRGEDNAGNTAVQIELFEVLLGGAPEIRFAHLPPLTDAGDGRRLASMPLRGLRNDGIEPAAVAACLAGQAPMPLQDMAARFRLSDMTADGLDPQLLLAANRSVLRGLDFVHVADRLPGGATEAFWLAVRGSLDLLKEARGWWDVVAGTIVPPVIEGEHELLLAAGALLPAEPWHASVWTAWIGALEQVTGRRGEALVAPLRLALTGEDSGPDLADLLPLIGRFRAANRLSIAAA